MREILKVLERDAHATPERISILTGLPEADVRRQVLLWQEQCILRRYKTVIDSIHFLLKKYKYDGDIFADSEADHRLMVAP